MNGGFIPAIHVKTLQMQASEVIYTQENARKKAKEHESLEHSYGHLGLPSGKI